MMQKRRTPVTRPHSRRGSAMLIALLILGVLLALALPLLASMILQQQKARTHTGQSQAQFHSDAVRNAAFQRLSNTITSQEWRSEASPPFNTPYYDSMKELQIPHSYLQNTINPASTTLHGISVEDEQGKVNLRTAPDHLVSRLQKKLNNNTRSSLFFTRYSSRQSKWVYPTSVRSIGEYGTVQLDDPTMFAKGTRVRLRHRNNTARGTVLENQGHAIVVEWKDTVPTFSDQDPGGTIWVRRRHPVHLNTARRRTLTALFAGINKGQSLNKTKEVISRSTAEELARFLVQKPIKNWFHFRKRLNQAVAQNILTRRGANRIFLNGISPSHMRLVDSGTLPYRFRTGGRFSLRSRTAIKSPTGQHQSSVTNRSIASIAVPDTTSWKVDSELELFRGFHHFDRFPFQYFRLRPVPFQKLFQQTRTSRQVELPEKIYQRGSGSIQLRPMEDQRGESVFIQQQHSFSQSFRGKQLQGNGMRRIDYLPSPADSSTHRDIEAGGIEFWIRFRSAPSNTVLFDAAESDTQNRIHLYLSNGKLKLDVADATLEQKRTSIQTSWDPEKNRWYHIGAYWKGSKYGLQGLMIDGHATGTTSILDEDQENLLKELEDPMDKRATNNPPQVQLNNTTGLPDKGAIEMGGEILEYNGKSGSTLKNVKRGSRGSSTQSHSFGVKAMPYGYSTVLESINANLVSFDGLSRAKAITSSSFGSHTSAKTAMNITQSNSMISAKFPDQLSPSDFPSPGVILLDQELIHYQGVDSNGFTNCTRGVLDTLASPHEKKSSITLFAFPVQNQRNWDQNYHVIQVGDEWIFPARHYHIKGQSFFGGYKEERETIRPFSRAVLNTTRQKHPSNSLVLPTFLTDSAALGSRLKTMDEEVTIVQKDGNKQLKQQETVHIGRLIQLENVLLSDWGTEEQRQATYSIAALDSALTDDVPANNQNRLLKFPSNELISYPYEHPEAFIGKNDPDVSETEEPIEDAFIDEIRVFSTNRGHYRLRSSLSNNRDDDKLLINQSMNQPGGSVLKVGDEWIGFPEQKYRKDEKVYQLLHLQRGYLESDRDTHNQGDRVFHLPFLPVTALAHPLKEKGHRIPLKSSRGFPDEGFVRIEDELIGYKDIRSGNELHIPRPSKDQPGLFRGSFGTPPYKHEKRSMVFAPPIRYPDWTSTYSDYHPSQAAYMVENTKPGATWKYLNWKFTSTPHDYLDFLIRLRDPERTSWRSKHVGSSPISSRGNLPISSGDGQVGLRSDRLQVQVLFDYLPGAWHPDEWRSHQDWKETAALQYLEIMYDQPTIIFKHHRIK